MAVRRAGSLWGAADPTLSLTPLGAGAERILVGVGVEVSKVMGCIAAWPQPLVSVGCSLGSRFLNEAPSGAGSLVGCCGALAAHLLCTFWAGKDEPGGAMRG